MRIAEPMTTLTDYLLGALGLWLGARLLRQRAPGRAPARLLGAALVAMAAGALLGGTVHGFGPALGERAAAALWKATVWSIGATAFLFILAVARATLPPRWSRGVALLASMQLALYVLWTARYDDFVWVIVNYAPTMLLALALQTAALRRGVAGAGWMVAAILLSFVGAAVQASGLTLHPHFNHNDLYHVLQMIAVWWFYRGGREMTEAA